jgi:hypothetical protein
VAAFAISPFSLLSSLCSVRVQVRRARFGRASGQRPGAETESIYRRYAIVDEAMHKEAAAKLDVWNSEQQGKAEAARKGQVKRFNKRQTA